MADDFEALARNLQLLIDDAFDAATASQFGEPLLRKRVKQGALQEPKPARGFIEDAPGGFIPPSEAAKEHRVVSEDDIIPLLLIPTALQILDLPPDDEEALQVFNNAAGGWNVTSTSGNLRDMTYASDEGRGVSRKDWRAVCAVLISSRENDLDAAEDLGGGFLVEEEQFTTPAEEQSLEEATDREDAEEDNYGETGSVFSSLSSDSDPGEESGSDQYPVGSPKSKSKAKSEAKLSRARMRSGVIGPPTPRQRQTALEAYALFFPSSPSLPDDILIAKRLVCKDISRIADLLKEKIKPGEITEMLSLFSASSDGSMGFEDFLRMMITAKLA